MEKRKKLRFVKEMKNVCKLSIPLERRYHSSKNSSTNRNSSSFFAGFQSSHHRWCAAYENSQWQLTSYQFFFSALQTLHKNAIACKHCKRSKNLYFRKDLVETRSLVLSDDASAISTSTAKLCAEKDAFKTIEQQNRRFAQSDKTIAPKDCRNQALS